MKFLVPLLVIMPLAGLGGYIVGAVGGMVLTGDPEWAGSLAWALCFVAAIVIGIWSAVRAVLAD